MIFLFLGVNVYALYVQHPLNFIQAHRLLVFKKRN
jgi:hypothetical protein